MDVSNHHHSVHVWDWLHSYTKLLPKEHFEHTHIYIYIGNDMYFQGRFHRSILHTHNHQILDTFKCPGICKSVHHETNSMLHKCLYNHNDFCMYLHFSLAGKVSKLHAINCARYFGNIRLCVYNFMSVAYTNGSNTTINLQPNFLPARVLVTYLYVLDSLPSIAYQI